MNRDLTQMSLAELWELFPIALVAPRPEWQLNYNEMEVRLRHLLEPFDIVRISHIGSTAIPRIHAKDIVDILVEAAPQSDLDLIAAVLEKDGFLLMSRMESRVSLNLGYTPDGFADKVYHVHLRYEGDHDELYFRDYLIDHPDVAHDYEQLKLDLWHSYEYDRDAYTAAKGDFIRKYTVAGKTAYSGRYE